MKALEAQGIDVTSISRKTLYRARTDLWRRIGTTSKVCHFDLEHCSITGLLRELVRAGPWRTAFRNLIAQQPCTPTKPYHLVVYADEIVPGNVLRLHNERKAMCWYFTIVEFPMALRQHVDMWAPFAIIASEAVKEIPGGHSNVARCLFRKMFLDERIADQGVTLHVGENDEAYRFFFKLQAVLLDGDAYRAVWSSKGASGKLPCLKCLNVISDKDIVMAKPEFVHFSEHDSTRFIRATSADIWAKADALEKKVADRAAGRCTQAALDMLSTAVGLTYQKNGLLWDKALREYVHPGTSITFDVMHNLYSNGIVQVESALALQAVFNLGHFTFRDFQTFACTDFRTCQCLGSHQILRRAVDTQREASLRAGNALTCTASEMLMLRPVLLHFLQRVVSRKHDIRAIVLSYEALSDLCSNAFDIKLGNHGLKDVMAWQAAEHLRLFKLAYTDLPCKPKHHYSLHADNEAKFDCFVGERKNSTIKGIANHVKNTRRFEFSVLSEAVGKQLSQLEACDGFADGMVGGKPHTHGVTVSAKARLCGATLAAGDVIFSSNTLLHVLGFVNISSGAAGWATSGLLTLADEYEFEHAMTKHASSYVRSSSSTLHAVQELKLAHCFYFESGSKVIVLL